MVDFKTPNLCGANTDFNSLVSKFVDIENVLTDNLNVDASALSGLLSPELTTLEGNLREMAPAAPELPNINLQSQITDLVNIDTSSVAGVSKYLGSLASITSNVDTGISAGGYSLTDIVSAASTALSGDGNLCAAIPNFELPAAGGAPVEKAANVLQASADPQRAALEGSSILNKNTNVTDAKTAVEAKAATWVNPDIETVPTEDIGAYKVATKSSEIVVSSNESGKPIKVKASTPKDLVTDETTTEETTTKTTTITESGGEVTVRKRKTVALAGAGHTVQRARVAELFTEDDIGGLLYPELTLKHVPYEIINVKGRDEQNKHRKSGKLFPRWRNIYTASHRYAGTRYDVYELVEGQIISIQNDLYEYEQMSQKVADKRYNGIRYVYEVTYKYLENYDSNWSD